MAAPVSANSINGGIVQVSLPSKTWKIDKKTNRIVGEADSLQAVSQAVEIILNIDRYKWQIFQPYSGNEIKSLIGWDIADAEILIQRYLEECLLVDDRVQGIDNLSSSIVGDSLSVSFTVRTVYGDTQKSVEVMEVD